MTATTREHLQDSIDCSPPNILYKSSPEVINPAYISPQSSSSYTLANDTSLFSRDVDHWIRGYTSPTESTGVQGSRTATVQRSTLVNSTTDSSGFWFILAAILPLFSASRGPWRCNPRAIFWIFDDTAYAFPVRLSSKCTILYTAEVCLLKCGRMCSFLGHQLRRLANNQYSREIFATVMDFVLVVYAIGFLILSMYQNSLSGVQQQ